MEIPGELLRKGLFTSRLSSLARQARSHPFMTNLGGLGEPGGGLEIVLFQPRQGGAEASLILQWLLLLVVAGVLTEDDSAGILRIFGRKNPLG